MRSDQERLEQLEKIIAELIERSHEELIMVEGIRDIQALRSLGIDGNVRAIQTGNSVINLCESLSSEFSRFIILTDWDRKGGQFAHLLRKAIEACGARHDDVPRTLIARFTKKEVKDVEGLPRYIETLRRAVFGNRCSDDVISGDPRKY